MVSYLGSCVEPEVGLDNPCVSFPAQDVLGFYDRGNKHDDVGVTAVAVDRSFLTPESLCCLGGVESSDVRITELWQWSGLQ